MISRLFDFVKGLISLALILALLVGVPIVLLVIVGYPLPTVAPTVEEVRGHLERGDIPNPFIIKTLAVVVWFVWFQLAVSALVETFALLRGRVSRRAPVLPGLQLVTGKLLASSLLIISAFLPNRSAVAAPIYAIPATEISAEAASPAAGAGGPLDLNTRNGVASDDGLVGFAEGSAGYGGAGLGGSAKAPSADFEYETKSGDSWWDVAERLLGDGMRWSELRDLNAGKTMLTGDLITERTEDIKGGWHLTVPADADPQLLGETAAPVGDAAASLSSATVAAAPDLQQEQDLQLEPEPLLQPEAAALSAPVDQSPASSPLMEAIKPFSLVYEGETGAAYAGPGVPYQVVEGDNLWDIAERHTGDPFRWPEIFERSTGLTQTFGRQITDPNLIWPDSIVILPDDASNVPPAAPELVEEVLGRGYAGLETKPATSLQPDDLRRAAAAAADGDALLDPTDPDGGRRISGIDAEAAENGASGYELTPDRFDGLGSAVATPVGLAFGAGGLLVASGLLGMLQRARRLRLAEAGAATVPAPPPMELVDIETVLRNSAGATEALSVHAVIASLAARNVVVGEPLAAPEIIRMGAERVEVVQQGADPDLPAPWLPATSAAVDASSGRSLAMLPAESFPAGQGSDVASETTAAPMCVTVGRGLMVNLEALGVVTLDGPTELVAGLVRSMVHELATGPARRSIDIRVSEWLPGADLHDHVRCGRLDNLAVELEPWLEDVELGLTATGGFSSYALRVGGLGQSVPDPKIIFADGADAELLAPLVERARRHSIPLAIVFSGSATDHPIEPTVSVTLSGDTVTLEPYGYTAAAQHLAVDLLVGAEALINQARRAQMIPRDDDQPTILPVDGSNPAEQATDPAQLPTEETPEHEIVTELPADEPEVTDRAEETDSGILVRVLGQVAFEGGPQDLSDEEQSLLSFLALVGPSTAEQLRDAVWPAGGTQAGSQTVDPIIDKMIDPTTDLMPDMMPDMMIDDVRFETVIGGLHAKLGPLFPAPVDGRYRVRSVITDLGSSRRWISQANAMSGERARNLMQLALSEVRGAPFTGVPERLWQWTNDHRTAIATQATSILIDACFDLCDGAYQANDIYLAKWACEVASLVDPLHETVVTRRAQLMGLLGEHAEAAQLVQEWEARYAATADRPAPRGPRGALVSEEVASNYVG